MGTNTGKSSRGSYLDSLEQQVEKVTPHTPKKNEPKWSYSLKEGGQKYRAALPTTDEQITKVKQQLQNPKYWKFWQISPYGGHRAYTLVLCFPPFDPIRVAEVFLPTGEVWNSRKRKFLKPNQN